MKSVDFSRCAWRASVFCSTTARYVPWLCLHTYLFVGFLLCYCHDVPKSFGGIISMIYPGKVSISVTLIPRFVSGRLPSADSPRARVPRWPVLHVSILFRCRNRSVTCDPYYHYEASSSNEDINACRYLHPPNGDFMTRYLQFDS